MKEDSKILMAHTSNMDVDAKAWYKMAQARIMKEVMAELPPHCRYHRRHA
jgi:hypothetical protein